MSPASPAAPPADRFKRSILMAIIVMAVLATVIAWQVLGAREPLSPVMTGVFAVTTAVLSVLFIAAWLRLLPQHAIEMACMVYAVVVCAVSMWVGLYSPRYGAGFDLHPLYLWVPVIYVFAFTLNHHRTGLRVSLAFMLMFIVISLPYLVHDIGGRYGNDTLQLHVVSAALIAALYFFSSYQQRLRVAQVTVEELGRLSNTDELTKLCNRRNMAGAIDAELARCAGGGDGFALLLFDIDHFKDVNDQLGHLAGDRALVAVAGCATELFRGLGTLGRWGGDEFVALVRGMSATDATHMADALCTHIGSEPMPCGTTITVSCGVTVATAHDSVDSLLQRVDAALYAAKRAGRNRARTVLEPVALELPQFASR